ncbi:MAG: hypothetical protein HC893_01455 [Chloroflexaceae bacterium]|nr:hypothetical protein [Chloroflexaceae bacterium]
MQVVARNIAGDGVPGNADLTDQDFALVISNVLVGPQGTLRGTVTPADSGVPLAGAQVQISDATNTFTIRTNSAGEYQTRLAVGTYTVRISAFGYEVRRFDGIVISEDATTRRDASLTARPRVALDGTVRDGAGYGYPLYAAITLQSGNFTSTVFTDPLTGRYSTKLIQGEPYNLTVNAAVPGYLAATRAVTATTDITANFDLLIDSDCTAPGYERTAIFEANFEENDGGFTSNNNLWQRGTPTSGPSEAFSGSNVWATNLAGNYPNDASSRLTSGTIDLSSDTDSILTVEWWQWLETEGGYDFASVEISNDGGTTWTTAYGPLSGDFSADGWTRQQIELPAEYATDSFKIRFHFTSDVSIVQSGWYIDDVSLFVLDSAGCTPTSGGLVIGTVRDANTDLPLIGATVRSAQDVAITIDTPTDPNVDDGFYILFAAPGTQPITAAIEGYGSLTQNVPVVADAIREYTFGLDYWAA